MSKTIYMYVGTKKQCVYDESIFTSDNSYIIGVDIKKYKNYCLKEIERKYYLKPFEVEQSSFFEFIKCPDKYSSLVRKIEFMYDLSEVEQYDLDILLNKKETDKLLDFIEEQRYEYSNDIKKVTFSLLNIHNKILTIEIDEKGVIIFNTDDVEEIKNIFHSNIIKLFYGIKSPQVTI